MSDRWTMLIDDEGPTSVGSVDRTLLIGDAPEASRPRKWTSPRRLGKIGSRHWPMLLGILAGAAVGFFAAFGLRAVGPEHGVRPGVYLARCGESDAFVSPEARAIDPPVPTLGGEPRNDSFDESLMVRRAADLVVANRYREALAVLRRLAEHRPEDETFLHLRSVLETKLRCDSSQSLGGGACD